MKRFIAGLVLAAVVVVFGSALAEASGVKYMSGGLLKWRTHKAAIVGDEGQNYGVDGAGGWIDSTGFYVPNAADGKDTSTVWLFPSDYCRLAAPDSLPAALIVLHNSAAGGSGDTLHVGPQVYLGGDQSTASNWLAVAAFPAVTNRVLTGAVVSGAVELFPAGTAGAFAGSEAAASTAPYTVMVMPGLKGAAGFRLITWGDGTAAFAGNGLVTVEILYPVCR